MRNASKNEFQITKKRSTHNLTQIQNKFVIHLIATVNNDNLLFSWL